MVLVPCTQVAELIPTRSPREQQGSVPDAQQTPIDLRDIFLSLPCRGPANQCPSTSIAEFFHNQSIAQRWEYSATTGLQRGSRAAFYLFLYNPVGRFWVRLPAGRFSPICDGKRNWFDKSDCARVEPQANTCQIGTMSGQPSHRDRSVR